MEINKIAFLIIVLAVTVLVLFLFVMPKYQESVELEAELAKKQAQYENKANYYLKLAEALKDIEQRKDVLEKIDSALPLDFQLAPVVNFLQEKSKEAGLAVESVSFSEQGAAGKTSKESQTGKVKNIMFKVYLAGNYQGLKKLLSYLEESARLFEVRSISFSASSPKNLNWLKNKLQTHDFTLDIETHTY